VPATKSSQAVPLSVQTTEGLELADLARCYDLTMSGFTVTRPEETESLRSRPSQKFRAHQKASPPELRILKSELSHWSISSRFQDPVSFKAVKKKAVIDEDEEMMRTEMMCGRITRKHEVLMSGIGSPAVRYTRSGWLCLFAVGTALI